METKKKHMMKKLLGRKWIALYIAAAMVISVVAPGSYTRADEQTKQWAGYVYLTVEKITLGQGCIVEPVKVPVYGGETMLELLQRQLGDKLLVDTQYNYISGYKDGGEPAGWTKKNIPAAITDAVQNDAEVGTIGARAVNDTLSGYDYTSKSGWMASLNNSGLAEGMSAYSFYNDNLEHKGLTYHDNDVIRLQFSVYGWGSDTNTADPEWSTPLYSFPDKDRLVRLIADYKGDKTKEEYVKAKAALNKWNADESEVKDVCNKLSALNKEQLKAAAISMKDKAAEYIHSTLKESSVRVYGSEWSVMTAARAGIDDKELYTDYYKNIIDNLREHNADYIGAESAESAKCTDNARVILALTAIGADASDVAGHNLIKPLADYQYTIKQGLNGAVYALIALDSGNYSIPEVSDVSDKTTKEKLIDYILGCKVADGGWNYTVTEKTSDPDMTSMVLCALAPYVKRNENVKNAVDAAINALETLQMNNGGYMSWGYISSESNAQVLTALSMCGYDAISGEHCIKTDTGVVNAVMNFALNDGSFAHSIEGDSNIMATQQCAYSLVAYSRLTDNKKSLYDMSDVTEPLYDKAAIDEYVKANEPTAVPTTPVPTAAVPTAAVTAVPATSATPATSPLAAPSSSAKPSAVSFTSNGLKYVTASNSTVICKGVSGKSVKKKLVIPATVKKNGISYKVTEIAAGAFNGNNNIKSVVIGRNVKKIGSKAFCKCKKLSKITIKSKSIKIAGNAFKSINKKAKIECSKSVGKYIKKNIKGIKTIVK